MRSPTFFFAYVLALLPSLSMAEQPIFSTVPPFRLTDGRFPPDIYNVTLKFQDDVQAFVPVLTTSDAKPTEFKIVNGNLTTADGSLGAYFGDFSGTELRPILFSSKVPVGVFVVTADFVQNAFFSPSAGTFRKLFSLNGNIAVRNVGDGAPLLVQPNGNNDPINTILLTIVPVDESAPATYSG